MFSTVPPFSREHTAGDAPVRPDPEGQVLLLPDVPQHLQQLVGEELLAQVVAALDDDGEQAPVLQVPVGGGLPDAADLNERRYFLKKFRCITQHSP